MRETRTLVFPLPAPASTSSGPSPWTTAARCSGFRSSTAELGRFGWIDTMLLQEGQEAVPLGDRLEQATTHLVVVLFEAVDLDALLRALGVRLGAEHLDEGGLAVIFDRASEVTTSLRLIDQPLVGQIEERLGDGRLGCSHAVAQLRGAE